VSVTEQGRSRHVLPTRALVSVALILSFMVSVATLPSSAVQASGYRFAAVDFGACTWRAKRVLALLREPWTNNRAYWSASVHSRIDSFYSGCSDDRVREIATGSFYGELGMWSEASTHFGRALNEGPATPLVMYLCAYANAQLENWTAAVAYSTQAIQLDPSCEPAILLCAEACLELGLNNRAISYINTLCEMRPADPEYMALYTEFAVGLILLVQELEIEVARLNAEVERLQEEVLRLEMRIVELEAEIASLRSEISRLEGEVSRLEQRVAELEQETAALRGQRDAARSKLRSAETRVIALESAPQPSTVTAAEVILGVASILIPYKPIQVLCTLLGILW